MIGLAGFICPASERGKEGVPAHVCPCAWVALTNLAQLHQLRTQGGGSVKSLEKFTLINFKKWPHSYWLFLRYQSSHTITPQTYEAPKFILTHGTGGMK